MAKPESLPISPKSDVIKELEEIDKKLKSELPKCPICEKDLKSNQKFCSEQCLKKYLEEKRGRKPETKEEQTIHEETTKILQHLGRSKSEGEVKREHLGAIIGYLMEWREGETQKTLSRLALRIGIDRRMLRENYWEGLEAEGLIEITYGSKVEYWKWLGLQ